MAGGRFDSKSPLEMCRQNERSPQLEGRHALLKRLFFIIFWPET